MRLVVIIRAYDKTGADYVLYSWLGEDYPDNVGVTNGNWAAYQGYGA